MSNNIWRWRLLNVLIFPRELRQILVFNFPNGTNSKPHPSVCGFGSHGSGSSQKQNPWLIYYRKAPDFGRGSGNQWIQGDVLVEKDKYPSKARPMARNNA